MIIGAILALLVSFFCFSLDSLGIGIVVSPVIEGFFTFGTWMFFKNKGDRYTSKVGVNIAQYAANLLPFVPTVLLTFIIRAVIHNHPDIVSTVEKAVVVATKV
jgi:hypothetical protein